MRLLYCQITAADASQIANGKESVEKKYANIINVLCSIMKGKLSARHLRFVQAWITLHSDELMANWTLAVDVKPYLDYEVFQALKDEKVFQTVRPFVGTIQWENEADLCPDTVYLDSIKIESQIA